MIVTWKINVHVFIDGDIDIAESKVRDFIARAKDAAKENNLVVLLYDQEGVRVELKTFNSDEDLLHED